MIPHIVSWIDWSNYIYFLGTVSYLHRRVCAGGGGGRVQSDMMLVGLAMATFVKDNCLTMKEVGQNKGSHMCNQK